MPSKSGLYKFCYNLLEMAKSEKIIDNLWMVGDSSLSHPKDACVYLLKGRDCAALIDAGAGENPEGILRNIESTGTVVSRVKYIVLTHCHIDHIGGVKHLRKATGASVVCHQLCAEPLERGDNERTAASWYGIELSPIKVDFTFSGDTHIIDLGNIKLNLIHTPGHSPDSISAYCDIENIRVLFGQDIHGPFSPILGSDITKWRASMEKLIALHADILCEGHYGVISGKDKVTEFIRSFIEEYF